ncbi:MAG TPA: hypothetical protein VE684_01570 [Crenalkalicoccus sp.]|nr:hypothetical protein [Crenalkalicoccus sp.]
MSPRNALLFQTHFFDRIAAGAFAKLRRGAPPDTEAIVLIHLAPGAPVPERLRRVPHHVVRTDELREPAYAAKCGGAGWSLWEGGHVDLILLHFFRAHPEYDRYWLVEYDVRFSGDWRRFFFPLELLEADLLTPLLRRRADQPDWMWWPTVRVPVPEAGMLCAFMPIFRVSRAGLAAVDAAWRAGWAGHSEAVWPTAIAAAGLRLADPGGDGPFTPPALRNRFYTATMHTVELSPGTLMWKPSLYRPGSRPDTLWHPVKPFWPRVELRQALHDVRADLYLLRRRLAGAAPARARLSGGGAAAS